MVGFSGELVVLGGQFEVMGCFEMRVVGFFEEFVVVFVFVFRHRRGG